MIFVYIRNPDNGGTIYSVEPEGKLKWSYQYGEICGTFPNIDKNNTFYIATCNVTQPPGFLYAINPDGTHKWKVPNPTLYSPAIDGNGIIYIDSNDGNFNAYNPDGSVKWKYKVDEFGEGATTTPVIGNDGTIYFGTRKGYVIALNPNGNLKWKFKSCEGIQFNQPSLSEDGTIFVTCLDGGLLLAINPDGSLKWKLELEAVASSSVTKSNDGVTHIKFSGESSSPVIGTNGNIYIGADSKYLYAIGDRTKK